MVNMLGVKIYSHDKVAINSLKDIIKTHNLQVFELSLEDSNLYFMNGNQVEHMINTDGNLLLNEFEFVNVNDMITNLPTETPIVKVN